MKPNYALLALPLAVAAAFEDRPVAQLSRRANIYTHSRLQARQEDESLAGIFGAFQEFASKGLSGAQKPVKVVEERAVFRSTAKRQTVRWGPIALPAANNATQERGKTMDPLGFAYYKVVAGMPTDSTFLYMEPKIVYEDGSIANINTGVYLHHILTMEIGKDEVLQQNMCTADEKLPSQPPKPMPISGIFGIGNDIGGFAFTSQDGKLNSGYYRGPQDQMILGGELVNYQNVSKNIYIDLEIEYVPGKPAGLIEAGGTIINMAGCSGSLGFNLPEGKQMGAYNVTSKVFPMPADGYILQQRGHLHDGGDSVLLQINGKDICTSKATYGGEYGTMKDAAGKVTWETIYRMSVCNDVVPVKKGDNITLTAFYDPGKHPMRENMHGMKDSEMGIMNLFFAVKPESVPWEDPKKFSSKHSTF